MSTIAVFCAHSSLLHKATDLAYQLQLPLVQQMDATYSCLLVVEPEHLALRLTARKSPGAIYVDFLSGSVAHRHRYGGGKGQLIARAVGLQKYKQVTVLDVSAGLGRDAFVLASLGCNVLMLERSPIMAALLQDGLARAQSQDWFRALQLQLLQIDAKSYLLNTMPPPAPDVIYFDPMFPESSKSALVKKEMRILREVVGSDDDAAELLTLALRFAKKRVVVKRAKNSAILSERKPDVVYSGKSTRFDIYINFQKNTSG